MKHSTDVELVVYDAGDPSVGIFPCSWTVMCPFCKDNTDKEELEFFRKAVLDLYKEFAEGRLTADYNFELEEQRKAEAEYYNQCEADWKDGQRLERLEHEQTIRDEINKNNSI